MDNLTVLEAYKAMIFYLDNLYKLTGSDDLGSLLGGMDLTTTDETMDPAAWHDWLDAVKKIKESG